MFQVHTAKPIALDSPDHIDPLGCKQDNYSNSQFNRRLYEILGNPQAYIMDLGCAGGGFINECVRDGYLAVGLEGSDFPLKSGFGHWPELYDKNLFTCDVSEDFHVTYNGDAVVFDCITAWELMEHFMKEDVDKVLHSIYSKLKQGGYFICSVFVGTKAHAEETWQNYWGFGGKLFHHRNIEVPSWWDDKFKEHGFIIRQDMKDSFAGQFIRGPGFGAHPDRNEANLHKASIVFDQHASINRVLQRI